MTTSTDAILAYGYDLGDPLEWEDLPAWWDPEAETEDGDPVDFHDAAEGRIPDDLAVKIIPHCSEAAPMFILATYSTTAVRGYPKSVDPRLLPAFEEGAGQRLARALEALGITPEQAAPAWLLASHWS